MAQSAAHTHASPRRATYLQAGKTLGRQPGPRPKSDRLAPRVLHAVDGGRSHRWIARDLGIGRNTIADIVKRHRANGSQSAPAYTQPLIPCAALPMTP